MDDPNGFRAGSPAYEPTSDSPADNTVYPSSDSSSVAGGAGAGAGAAPILGPDDSGNPDSINAMPSTAQSITGGGGPQPAAPSGGGFFKNLVTMLGLALSQGVKAGVGAPRNAQGPAIAADTAIQQPQKDLQTQMANTAALTSQQQATLGVALTQVKIHQLEMIVAKQNEEQQDAAYLHGRDFAEGLLEKGQADLIVTGDHQAVEQEWEKRQADAKANGTGLLPLQILPAPGSSKGDGKFALIQVGKGKLTEASTGTWGADELGIDKDEFAKAGLVPFKFNYPAGMDTQKYNTAYTTQHAAWYAKNIAAYSKWKQTEANNSSREKIAIGHDKTRLSAAQIADSTRRAGLAAKTSSDKDLIGATRILTTANNNLAKLQDKFKNSAYSELSGEDARSLKTAERAQSVAQGVFNREYDRVNGGSKGGAGGGSASAAVKPGTPATPDILHSYLAKSGGDKDKARAALKRDGYVIPAAQKK